MFEHAKLVLYGQVTEERKWGVVLLALSLVVAVPVAWTLYQTWIGWVQYVAAAGGFVVSMIFSAQVLGPVLSRVRKRWFV